MIFDPGTVLVLGAGASAPYGFPLGQALKHQIIAHTANTSSDQAKQLVEMGLTEDDILAFHTDLVRSIHPTIDAFLEDRPTWRAIGAFAIAQVLMPLESEQKLFPHNDWYPMLFQELDLRDYSHTASVTAIVTLNYDRSVEHYLTETTQRTYEGQTRAKALEKLQSVRVIHVHGQLGSYPQMRYVTQRTTEDIKKGAQGISLVHDQDLDNSEVFQDAALLIASAPDVLFLGFGYDQRTLRRLGVFGAGNGPKLHGTGHGMSAEWLNEVKEAFSGRLTPTRSPIVSFLPGFHTHKIQERQKLAKTKS